ncbi:hypothetical protein ACOMHN_060235 [Nucella lapillus]
MANRNDLLKMTFVCLCLLHVTLGHSCGIDPRIRLENTARQVGRDINYIIRFLKDFDPFTYLEYLAVLQRYENCVSHTGYFKRSMGQGMS